MVSTEVSATASSAHDAHQGHESSLASSCLATVKSLAEQRSRVDFFPGAPSLHQRQT